MISCMYEADSNDKQPESLDPFQVLPTDIISVVTSDLPSLNNFFFKLTRGTLPPTSCLILSNETSPWLVLSGNVPYFIGLLKILCN